ncbi:MAG: VCBS repeat-containing protein, partial [Planctomycetota bacterium]|nr:VCBS repeat-containing protein [Planctomycetota bacterium]
MALSTVRLKILPYCFLALLATGLPAAAEVSFQNVTTSSGVDYLHWDGVQPAGILGVDREFLQMIGAAAAGDYDNDGWCDLYVTRFDEPNLLFHNLQDGTFEEVGAAAGVDLDSWSTHCGWGDVDNDGFLDLYVLTFDRLGRDYLYMNNGAGGFTESAVARGVDIPEPSGQARRMSGAAFGDYDLDGALDLMVTEWSFATSKNLLFHNDGLGFFTDVSTAAGVSLANVFGFAPKFADVNNDGWPDLLVAADFQMSKLLSNLGNGQFQDVTLSAGVGTDENGMGSAVDDYDNDGDLDWFVTSIYDGENTCDEQPCTWSDSGNRLYRNELNFSFSDATDSVGVREGYWGWGTSFLDFDNDGDLDLGMTNGIIFPWAPVEDLFNEDPARLWENDGTGVMTEVSGTYGFVDTGSGKGFLVFDFDRDGDQDVFIVNNGGHPVL